MIVHPTTTYELIGPGEASALLSGNTGNRILRPQWVDALAARILSGNWHTTHQGIGLSIHGRLLDGQHRLHAIVKAGIPVTVAVTRGLPEDARKVMDVGMRRLSYDLVDLVNDQATNRHLCVIVNAFVRHGLRQHLVSADTIAEEYLKLPGAWDWTAAQFPERSSDGLMRASIKAAIATYRHVAPAKAETFAIGYRSGANLSDGSPILALRTTTPAVTPGAPANYWRTIAAIKAHMEDRPLYKIHEASVDLLGNKNSYRLLKARTEKALKGVETRREQGAA